MSKFVEMQVDSIRVHMPSGQHVVILKEKDAERFLPIWIGIYEANAIALKITNITPERPITHDLLANILQSADMKLKKIQVTALTNVPPKVDAGFASYSPDGSKIVLTSNLRHRDGRADVYTMNANGTGLSRIVSDQPAAFIPDWGTHP